MFANNRDRKWVDRFVYETAIATATDHFVQYELSIATHYSQAHKL